MFKLFEGENGKPSIISIKKRRKPISYFGHTHGEPKSFHSALVPPYTASLEAALPWLYLKGISTGEMHSALEALVGPEAKGLSASTISRLKQRRLQPLELAVGDGAMGFGGPEEIFPQTSQQPLLDAQDRQCAEHTLPKTVQPKAKRSLHDIRRAPTREDAEDAFDNFIETYEPRYPKAVATRVKDRDVLMTFYEFPAIHWQHLRTTNPIESTSATIRHRTARTKGGATRESMLHMMFKLGECTEEKWRRLRGFAYLAEVIERAKFVNGKEVRQPDLVAA